MTKIDICDDEQLWIIKARDIIGDYFNDRQEVELNFFDDSRDLLNKVINKREFPDIIILDIDMPKMSGFEIATLIKNAYPDIILLFYTVHEQYVFEAFQFQPFRYIRKVNAETELKLALAAACKVLSNKMEKSIVINVYNETYAVDINNIIRFETDKRRCNIYLSDGRILNVRLTIKELLSKVNSPDFVMIHSGAVVNVRYVKHITAYDMSLENGEHLIVSRGRVENLKTALSDYWRRRI